MKKSVHFTHDGYVSPLAFLWVFFFFAAGIIYVSWYLGTIPSEYWPQKTAFQGEPAIMKLNPDGTVTLWKAEPMIVGLPGCWRSAGDPIAFDSGPTGF